MITNRIISLVATIVGAFVCAASFAAEIEVGLVTELNRSEVYEGHTFHDGLLFVGQLRQSDQDKHRVEVYSSPELTKVADLKLAHSASFIYPFGERAVLVTGRSSWPWKTHYSVISWMGGSYVVNEVTFPEEFQMHEFAGNPGSMFFNEPGSRAVYRLERNGGLVDLNVEVSGPGQMEVDGDILWILERKSLYQGDENIAFVHTPTGTVKRLFAEDRNGLNAFLIMRGQDFVVASESAANNVLVVQKSSGKIVAEVPVTGGPRGLVQVGSCAVVVSDEGKEVHFIMMNENEARVIDSWDVSQAGDRLKQPRRIAADTENGRLFLRSNYPCPSCSSTQSSVFYVAQKDNETFAKCMSR